MLRVLRALRYILELANHFLIWVTEVTEVWAGFGGFGSFGFYAWGETSFAQFRKFRPQIGFGFARNINSELVTELVTSLLSFLRLLGYFISFLISVTSDTSKRVLNFRKKFHFSMILLWYICITI
jgi:hypothetical protein